MNKRGSATVFTAVLMPVVLMACVFLSDACLYDSGSRIIENSVGASAYSILGKYSGYLKDNYDLYAYCMSPDSAESIASENLNKNLGESGIFDFRIEEISIKTEGNITDDGIMLQMLERSAADDIYKTLVDECIERFDVLSGVSGAAEIITLKMKIDKAYKKIKDCMTALNNIINGKGDLDYYVNFAGLDSGFAKAVSQFNEYRRQIISIEQEILELKEELSNISGEKAGILNLLNEQAGLLRIKAADVYSSFIEGLINGLMEANEEAVGHIRDIFTENANIHVLSDAIKTKMGEIENCPVYLKEILKTCAELIADVEEVFVEQVFEELMNELDKNILMLSNLEDIFIKVIEDAGQAGSDDVELPADGYNSNVLYLYNDDMIPGKGDDKRGFFEALGRKVLERQTGGDVLIKEDIILPSKGIDGSASDFTATSLEEDTVASEKELNELPNCAGVAENCFLRNLAVNEYIMQHFRCETTGNGDEPPSCFFKNEIEYIIWGSKSQAANIFFTKAALMSTRFALDAIHVYTDSEKCAKSDVLAAATAGWWTMGAGIPVMSNLIKISWAIAEAGADTVKLRNGESIPIIKTGNDWMTDIGVGRSGIPSPEFLKMDYGDYLRLYLAAVPLNHKIMRMMDIMSLNAPENFNIFSAYTKVTVSAVISFRRLTGGRHEVEISITESY